MTTPLPAPPAAPGPRTCPKCAHGNLPDSNYCVKCGHTIAGGVYAGPDRSPVRVVPRSVVAIAGAKLAISAVSLGVVLTFLLLVFSVMGGGPFGGGGVKVTGVDASGPGWLSISNANCGPCESSPGGVVKISVDIKNSDAVAHAVTDVKLSPSDFQPQSGSVSFPLTLQPGQSQTVSADLKAPGYAWEGKLALTFQG